MVKDIKLLSIDKSHFGWATIEIRNECDGCGDIEDRELIIFKEDIEDLFKDGEMSIEAKMDCYKCDDYARNYIFSLKDLPLSIITKLKNSIIEN